MPVTRTITLTIDETRVKPDYMVGQAVELLNSLLWGVKAAPAVGVPPMQVRQKPFNTRKVPRQ